MNNDLISRSELKKALKSNCDTLCNDKNTSWCEHCCPLNDFEDLIDNAPTVVNKNLTTERPQGEWYHSCEKGWECSQCHEVVKEMPTAMRKANCNFCPNCGADMRGKEK